MASTPEALPEYDAPNAIAAAVWQACIEELEAPKPGNVNFASAGHGMTAADFVVSARCVAGVLGTPGLSLGERVLAGIEATRAAVGCNTNLGIVLLCAPLAQAALEDEREDHHRLHTGAYTPPSLEADIATPGAQASRPQRTGVNVRLSRDAGIAVLGARASRPQRTEGPGPGSAEKHGNTRNDGAGDDTGFRASAPASPPHTPAERLRASLVRVLATADIEDTERVFEAIRLAGPAGLNESARHDVRAPAAAPLLVVMQEAGGRDRVARQYARCFEDVFDLGLPELAECRSKWPRELAVAALYLIFLTRFKDSHIERKLGSAAAERVRLEALEVSRRLDPSKPPAGSVQALADFDRSLKSRRINPGTSADLTVATLLADNLLKGGIASCPGASGMRLN